jgi:hypothetical protein
MRRMGVVLHKLLYFMYMGIYNIMKQEAKEYPVGDRNDKYCLQNITEFPCVLAALCSVG